METTQAPNFFDKCMKSLVSNQTFRKTTTKEIQIRFQQDTVFIVELFLHLRFTSHFEVLETNKYSRGKSGKYP